jgi:pimeloyl-ACP methyl ester carboxylesterase
MARVLAAQGIGSVVIDNLGTGESPVPDHVSGWHLSRQVYADAYQHLVAHLRERLTTGTLCDGLAPVEQPFVVGVGHSMGGILSLQLQASSGVCDALCLLGWATRTLVPLDDLLASVGMSADLSTLITPNGSVPPAALRASVRPWFFAPSVPAALIEADEQDATVMPAGMLASVTPGALAGEAAQIDCPLFLGFAAGQEVTSRPHEEAAAYPAVRSLTLFVQSQAHHCANFAPTRFELWDEIAWWGFMS